MTDEVFWLTVMPSWVEQDPGNKRLPTTIWHHLTPWLWQWTLVMDEDVEEPNEESEAVGRPWSKMNDLQRWTSVFIEMMSSKTRSTARGYMYILGPRYTRLTRLTLWERFRHPRRCAAVIKQIKARHHRIVAVEEYSDFWRVVWDTPGAPFPHSSANNVQGAITGPDKLTTIETALQLRPWKSWKQLP